MFHQTVVHSRKPGIKYLYYINNSQLISSLDSFLDLRIQKTEDVEPKVLHTLCISIPHLNLTNKNTKLHVSTS